MSIEQAIMAWVTRADMFILSAWPYILLALTLVAAALFAWTISDCVTKIQGDEWRHTRGRRKK